LTTALRRVACASGNPAPDPGETIMTQLYIRDGFEYREASAQDVFERAQALMAQRFRAGCPVFDSPAKTREFLRLRFLPKDYEVFSVLFLTRTHRLIEYVELFRGTIDGASVHPREVVKEALARGAAALICAHGHPSGNPVPSEADRLVTQKLKEACSLFDISVLDHLVIGETVTSMAELGLM
jgi:DNA repair protein RadC